MILIDSDIVIEVNRGRDQGILDVWDGLGDSGELLAYSSVTVAELWHGARPSEHDALDRLFNAFTCLPVTAEIGRAAGQYLSRYQRSHGLLLGDASIAATASVHTAVLWPRNRRNFPMKDVSLFAGRLH